MRDYFYSYLFDEDSIDKQLIIETSSGITIDNTMLNAEEFSLEESICSEEQLTYGCCESSCIKFRVSNIIDTLIGEELTVSIVIDGHTEAPLQIGKYIVDSDKPTANRDWRDITAYDVMKQILDTDVTDWYSTVFPTNDTPVTCLQLRNSLFTHLGIAQDPAASLINDYIYIYKTLNVVDSEGVETMREGISGKDILTRICEMNACFGHIDYLGRFTYVTLKENKGALYPAEDLYPSDELYPKEPSGANVSKGYREFQYEDYVCEPITRIIIRESENDIGYISSDDDTNTYAITGNFLLYGKSSTELAEIATNIYNAMLVVSYRAMSIKTRGNYCTEVGDLLRLHTGSTTFYTYMLERKISGIQSLVDDISAKGGQFIDPNNNSMASSILQIKGKSNKLERSIEETKSTIADVEQSLESEITQQAGLIALKVAKGDVRSEFALESGSATISSGLITFNSNTFVVNSTNFSVTNDGTMTAKAGLIAGFNINPGSGFEYNHNNIYCNLTRGLLTVGGLYNGAWCRADLKASNGRYVFDYGGISNGGVYIKQDGNNNPDSMGSNYIRIKGTQIERHVSGWATSYPMWIGTDDTSDRNAKKDIKSIPLEKVKTFFEKINPVRFKYKKSLGIEGTFLGLIAQDVEAALSDIDYLDGNVIIQPADKTPDGYMKLHYYELNGMEFAGIKYLYEIVEKQQKQIDSLEKRVEELELTIKDKLSTI